MFARIRSLLTTICCLSLLAVGAERPAHGFDSEGASSDVAGDDHWASGFSLSGADSDVACAYPYRGGIVIAGKFEHVQDAQCAGLAWWDGVRWSPLGTGFAGWVSALSVNEDSVRAFGLFTVDGVRSQQALWDGTEWHALPYPGEVFRVLDHGGRTLGVLGRGGVGGGELDSLVQWTDVGWVRYGDPVPFQIRDLVERNGRLYVYGRFGKSNEFREQVLRQTESGWEEIGPPTLGYHTGLAEYRGDLYACGSFPHDQAVMRRWTGEEWVPFGDSSWWGTTDVRSLAVFEDALHLAGHFSSPGNDGFSKLLRLDGEDWRDVGVFEGRTDVESIWPCGETLVCSGNFSGVSGTSSHYFALWSGTEWTSPGRGGHGLELEVHAMYEWRGDLYTVALDRRGRRYAQSVVRWNGAGWSAVGDPMDGSVDLLGEFRGDLVAVGNFETVGGAAARSIAFWDGVAWHPMGEGFESYSDVGGRDLIEFDGRLMVAGEFEADFDSGVIAWDGISWEPFGMTPRGAVHSLVVHDGSLYAGGQFDDFGGFDRTNLLRWNRVIWRAEGRWGGYISDLCVYKGNLVAGGRFRLPEETDLSTVAKLEGGTWHRVGGVSADEVTKLTVYNDDLIVSRDPNSSEDPLGWIARLVDDRWESLGSGVDGGRVRVLESQGGALWVGGSFQVAGGKNSSNIARWDDFLLQSSPHSGGMIRAVYPQPSAGEVTILYESPSSGRVEARIFDAMGRRVRLLHDRYEFYGRNGLVWDGRDDAGRRLPAGTYQLRIAGDAWSRAHKIVLIN